MVTSTSWSLDIGFVFLCQDSWSNDSLVDQQTMLVGVGGAIDRLETSRNDLNATESRKILFHLITALIFGGWFRGLDVETTNSYKPRLL